MANAHLFITNQVPVTALPSKSVALVLSDTVDLANVVRGIECWAAGDVKVSYVNGGTSIWTMAAGERRGGYISRVWATGTTIAVGNMVGLDP